MNHHNLEQDGFEHLADGLNADEVDALIAAVGSIPGNDPNRPGYALRDLLRRAPEVAKLATSKRLFLPVQRILGFGAFPVRALFFDKTPQTNWKVAWHQDVTIAVASRGEYPGFGPWSLKEGVVHVQPPDVILEQMLSVRIHLDHCAVENGALKVIPGSHQRGRLKAQEIMDLRLRNRDVVCDLPKGGVLLMRPLLLHASSASKTPSHRRVIHIEYAAAPLPGGLEWHEAPGRAKAVQTDL